jgi:P-type conjugative transfer ATPase TrbB
VLISRRDEGTQRVLAGLTKDLGDLIAIALSDRLCEDVILNDDGQLWMKRLSEPWLHLGELSEDDAESVVRAIAHLHHREIPRDAPILEAVIPENGSRFEGVLPPICSRATFCIRKRAIRVYTLSDYVHSGILECDQAEELRLAISQRKTIIVSGSTGSGKTTLVNALLHAIEQAASQDRVILIEEVSELQCCVPNTTSMLTTEGADLRKLVRVAMRLRPDRIIIGEVRGPEALDMLKAFLTGHPGLSTVHGDNCDRALARMATLVNEGSDKVDALALIRDAVDVVVHINGPTETSGRKVTEIRWLNRSVT